jgi:peptide methionine sulfoxide reductase msrA/msrB
VFGLFAHDRGASSLRDTQAQTGADTTALPDSGEREVITLAGGCFWCMEAYLQETPGVVDVVSGYAGGDQASATYLEVSTGSTEHRESVQVTYDPKRITTKEVLDVFWSHIDPTDAGGQFADRGPQYTTAIFYHTPEQQRVAEDSKRRLEKSGLFTKPIVTMILPFTTFFKAEEYHQDYYKKAAAHYEAYKRASGRAGFVEDTWAKDAAILFLSGGDTTSAEPEASATAVPQETMQRTDTLLLPSEDGFVYTGRAYSAEEIATLQKKLDPLAYRVLAEDGTEQPFKNTYWDNHAEGLYVDAVTGKPLFSSVQKYESGTGWPSFWAAISPDVLTTKDDYQLFTPRTEMRSEGGHIGHIFDDGPPEHGGMRYCANSAALYFIPKDELSAKGYSNYTDLFN